MTPPLWFQPFPLLASLAYVALATTVTIDVLLKKSDVRAALGWIGVAWFSPIIGALLYYLFGINRVTRRATQLDRPDRPRSPGDAFVASGAGIIAPLAEVGRRVTGKPIASGNHVIVLDGGEVAYPEMLKAIAAARRSVAMASYIFRNDRAGKQFAQALGDARARGVEVRVLLDSVGSGYIWQPMLRRLRAAGVKADAFLHTWIPWRMPFLNMRNHRKLLIVDGMVGFVGGMNIGEEYDGRIAAPQEAIDDVHFRIEGPAVREIFEAFARDWAFTTDEQLEGEAWWPAIALAGQACCRGIRSGPDADIYKIETVLGAALIQAQHRIRIVTPYFLPDQRLQFAIAQAVLRGVEVDIVLPERSDYLFMDWAVRAHLRFFRHTPANFYFTPRPFNHAKLVTMDGTWCLIGSSNWDARSLRLNFEFDVECYDPVLPVELDRLIDRRLARGRRFTPADLKAPLWILLRDGLARLMMPYL